MRCEYSPCLAVPGNKDQRCCMLDVQRIQPLNIDLTGHVRRRCVAGRLGRMVSLLLAIAPKTWSNHTKVVFTYCPPT
jgi:hypothetical protein